MVECAHQPGWLSADRRGERQREKSGFGGGFLSRHGVSEAVVFSPGCV